MADKMNKKNKFLILLIGVFLAGFLIKAYYVSYTETWMRQHDVISFGAEEGHAAYIEYILNNKSLPDFDPREKWAFFQPPLHHIICAASMAVSMAAGFSQRNVQENVQLLTLLYMCLTMLISYGICKKLSLSKRSTIISMAIIAMHPIFILLSGSINNDALSLVLAILAIYLAIVWYEKPSLINTVLLALTIGLSMMAKLTGALVAPGIGILMLMKIFEEKKVFKGIKDYFVRLVIFAVIVVPTGLWWSVRNVIKWHMPVNYIPPVGEQFPDEVTLIDRLFDMTISSPYVSLINNGDAYDEHNVFYALVKTSLFGEYNYNEYSRVLVIFAWILLVVSVVLALFALYATVKVLENYVKIMTSDENTTEDGRYVVLAITYIAYLFAYLSFALSYSNFSAQDFRYAAITIIIESIFLGKFIDMNESKWFFRIVTAFTAVFCMCSLIIYTVIGLRS